MIKTSPTTHAPAAGSTLDACTGAAVHITDLHRSFGEVRAVRGVDLRIAPGEVVAFLGPNGAGRPLVGGDRQDRRFDPSGSGPGGRRARVALSRPDPLSPARCRSAQVPQEPLRRLQERAPVPYEIGVLPGCFDESVIPDLDHRRAGSCGDEW